MSKKRKKIALITTSFLIIISLIGFYSHNYVEAQKKEEINAEKLDKAKEAISDLYNGDKTSLAKDMSMDKIFKAEKLVDEVEDKNKKKQLKEELDTVVELFNVDQQVKSLLNSKGVITDDVDSKQIDQTRKSLEEIKEYNESIYNQLEKKLDTAAKQVKTINYALEKVKKVEKNPNEKGYKEAKKQVKKIQNKKWNGDLSERLNKVNKKLKEIKQTKEKEKKKSVQEAQPQEQITQSQNSTTSSSNSGQSSSEAQSQDTVNKNSSNSQSQGTVGNKSGNSGSSSSSNSYSGNSSSKSSNGGSSNSDSSSGGSSSSKGSGGSSSSGKGSEYKGEVNKTGEGSIKNYGGDKSGRTYETWEFKDDGSIPWDEFD